MNLCINMEDLSPFAKLQPICVKLARCGSVEIIDKLQETVKEIEKESIIIYQEYIIFPVRLILLKKPNEKLLIRAIDFLTYLFDCSEVCVRDVFTNIFSELINILTNIPNPERVCDASEELKLSVCCCIISLVKNTNKKILNEMYSQSYRLTLAQAFFVFLQLLKYEKSKVLRQKLLKTIGTLAYNPEDFPRRSSNTEKLASESLANFFPGLSSALMNVISGDVKQGQQIFRMAVNIFSELIVVVMNDKYCQEQFINENTFCESVNSKSKLENVIKDNKWFKETSSVLKTMMCNMKHLIIHDQWKVRLEFLKFIDSVLSNCQKTLENCVTVLLPCIFALSVDTHPQIQLQTSNLILKFSHKFQSLDSNSLLILIEEDIHLSTSFLIKSKFSSNDDQILNVLRTLLGYIKVFDKSIDKLLLSSSNLERIFLSLINILELDINIGYLVEDISLLEHSDLSAPLCDRWPKKTFSYFQNREILNTISDICYCIGKFSSVRIVTDFLSEKQLISEQYELQCLLLTSKILEGVVDRPQNEDTISFVEDTISQLFSTSIWESSPLNHHKIHQICLVLEIIGKCSKVVKLNFKPFLIKILFPVLEQAGSSNSLISRYGKICLYTIACYCCYSSVAILIQDNVDYIMNSITINFHHFVTHPEMAVVLSVIISECNADILPYCKGSIYHLFSLLDCNQHQSYVLLQILKNIVHSIKQWFPVQEKSNSNQLTDGIYSNKNLKSAVTTFKKTLENSDSDSETRILGSSSCQKRDNVTKTDYEAAPPLHISITIEILKRCTYLQSSSDKLIKILCLEMMENCILILGNYEVQLHPVIHDMWPRFIFRFHEGSSVTLAAFRVLLVMADQCRDFIRRRVLQDLFQKFINLLKKNFSNSLKQNFRNYQWQSAFKLHLCVLSEMGNLFTKLEVSGKEITLLAEVCLSYLNKLQSRTFQEAAYKTIKDLITLDSDIMWLYFNILYCDNKLLKAPHDNFYNFCFPNSSCTLTEFKIDI